MKKSFSWFIFLIISGIAEAAESSVPKLSTNSTGTLMQSVQQPTDIFPGGNLVTALPVSPAAESSQPNFEITVTDVANKNEEKKPLAISRASIEPPVALNLGAIEPEVTIEEGIGPKKPETPVEVAEAGIVEQWPISDVSLQPKMPAVPIEPKPEVAQKVVAEKEKVELELTPPECLPSELDTTGMDAGGNWVIKRAFWELAEKTYEKIMKANNELYDLQVNFVQARNDIDKMSDIEFRELGFEQGKVAELLDNLIEETKMQQEVQGDLDEKERQFLKTAKEKQAKLEQLKLDLVAVDELEDALGTVMSNLSQQVGVCRKYEKQAWEHFKAIGKELNDKKARLLFYEMEGFLKTVEKNRDYIANELWSYFNESAQQVKDHLNNIKNAVNELKQNGIDLVQELEQFEKADQEKDQKEIEAEKAVLEKERAEIAKKKKELDQGFMHKFTQLFVKAWGAVKTWITTVYKAVVAGISNMIASILKLFGMKK